MVNIFIIIKFNGNNYHGWQKQKLISTIQNILEIAIFKIIHQKIKLIGCGRTDAYVNAKIYICNFKCEKIKIPIEKFSYILNNFLPNDIIILHSEYIDQQFHSQFSCIQKEYTYIINNNKNNDPFFYNKCYFYPNKLNINNMKIASKLFIGKYNFQNFCNPKCICTNKIRKIFYINIIKNINNFLLIKICANGFLYNMARIIGKVLLDIGINRISFLTINNKLYYSNYHYNLNMLPSYGLYLTKIVYKNFSITI